MKKSRLAISVLIIGVLCPMPGLTLDPQKNIQQYVKRHWHVEDGLPMGSVTAVAQSADGYIWAGTMEGAVRFDGVSFELFDSETTNGALGDDVRTIKTAPGGAVWIGSGNGVVQIKKGEFTRFGVEDGLSHNSIRALFVETDQKVWVGTDHGLNVIEHGKVTALKKKSGLRSKKILSLEMDKDGAVWAGTTDGLFKKGKKKFRKIDKAGKLPSEHISALFFDRDGVLWIGTLDGLAILGAEGISTFGPENQSGIRQVTAILQDSHGNLWFGGFSAGLSVYRNGKFTYYGAQIGYEEGVIALAEDHEQNLWIGSHGAGLLRLADGKLTTINPSLKREVAPTLATYGDSTGALWFSTYYGLSKYENGQFTVFGQEAGLISKHVLSVTGRAAGGLWIGTAVTGIAKFENGRFSFIGEEQGLPDPRVRSLHEDKNGVLWIGTLGGLIRYADEVFTHFTTEDGLPANRINHILPNKDGSLWLGTESGLSLFKEGIFVNKPLAEDGPSNRVFDIFRDERNYLWIATYNGIVLYRNGRINRVTRKDGLAQSKANSLIGDDDGNLWFGSNKGIFVAKRAEIIDQVDGKIKKFGSVEYGTADGMILQECNGGYQRPSWKSKDNKIYMATEAGVVVIDPRNLRENKIPPEVVVEEVIVDGGEIEQGDALPPGKERFIFNFAGLSYLAPEKMSFKYKLEGFDKDWVQGGDSRQALYTNLDGGKYRFRVIAANNDGVWNEEGAAFGFEIEPRLTETWYFWLLLILGIGIVILVISRIRMAAVRTRDQRLNEMAWDRTRNVLESEVGAIRKVAGDVSQVARNIKEMMVTMSSAADQVAAAVSETASTVEEMGQTSKSAEKRAADIVATAGKMANRSNRGQKSVDDSSEVMSQIQQDSVDLLHKSNDLVKGFAEMDTIVLMVKEIADQSKILSINAAMEAKRAGNKGAGFSVVANQMKELAGQSKSSAGQINGLLSSIVESFGGITHIAKQGEKNTEKGVLAIRQSGEIVDELVGELDKNSSMADVIATSIEQQLSGLNYIINAVSEIRTAVSDNNRISRDVSREADQLNNSIDSLLELIVNWRTPEFYQQKRV